MRKIKSFRRALCWLLLGAMLFAMAPVVRAEGTLRRRVRVAFPEQAGMSYIGQTGKLTGYNYDYLEKISEYTGWEMEYIAYPAEDGNEAVGNAIQDLTDGNVDLLGPMLRSEATEQMFEYPETSYGTVYTTLCAPLSRNMRDSDLHSGTVFRIGLWEKAQTRNNEVLNYLQSENIPNEIRYYDSSEAQKQALWNGEVDMISGLSLSPIDGTRIVAKFAARPYYFVSTKGNTELIRQLDEAMSQMARIQPGLQDQLFDTYFVDKDSTVHLTQEQTEKLLATPSVNVLCIDQDAPYAYSQEGEPKGALILAMDEFARQVGIEFHYTFCNNRAEAETLLDSGMYTVLVGIPFTSAFCAKKGLIRSEPIFSAGMALARGDGRTDFDTVAVVRGLEETGDLSVFGQVVVYDSAPECLEAVAAGEVSAAAGDRSVMSYYIYDSGSTLSTRPISGKTHDVCLAVSRSRLTLLEALNSFISGLSDYDKTMYLDAGSVHSDKMTLSRMVKHNPMQAVLIVSLVVLALAAGIFMAVYYAAMSRKNRELAKANEVKSDFLSRMSHDIRTPINGIVGMAEIASRSTQDPQAVAGYLQKIRTASSYLLSILNDVLDMRKLEAGGGNWKTEPADLPEILSSCVDMLSYQAGTQHVLLVTDDLRDFRPPRVLTSPQYLRRVFMNLISNALKYNREYGRVYLGAQVTEETKENITCRFTVTDTGIGMGEDFQSSLFQPFMQEREDSRGEFRGTGLGLSIVKSIVDKMGGTIRIDSKKNQGTSVEVMLTFQKAKEETAEQDTGDLGAFLIGRHILAAEDNELNAEILQLQLSQLGAEVTMVGNGRLLVEAFEGAAPYTFDLILTDLMMPELDGYGAAQKIRSSHHPDGKRIPILALTADVLSKKSEKWAQCGIDAVLTKPIELTALKRKLSAYLPKKA